MKYNNPNYNLTSQVSVTKETKIGLLQQLKDSLDDEEKKSMIDRLINSLK